MSIDVVIVGGGPAGLSAALAFGRARKRVLLCDAGPRRNAAAEHMQNFVTRDGTPPSEFRRIGREQLATYPNVEVRDVGVEAIAGERGAFTVTLASGPVTTRRVLLCTGMIDELPAIEGFREHWGRSIVICPYCHGWEVKDQRFAVHATSRLLLEFALLVRGWSRSVVALTDGRFELTPDDRERMTRGGVALDERRIARIVGEAGRLDHVAFVDGASLAVDIVFAKPPQAQVPIVRSLGLATNELGYLEVDPLHRETSIPGIYAAGDLVTPMQSAMLAAASGSAAAMMMNHELTVELALAGTI